MFEHLFETETVLPAPRERIFPFFSDANNLARITPTTLDFQVLNPEPIVMREGTLIDYRIRLHGIPMRWRTRISMWNPPFEFEDEQLRGPYRTWIHHHQFKELPDGKTLMRDRVRYALPMPPFGEVALPWVRAEIRRIFEFRTQTILGIFSAGQA